MKWIKFKKKIRVVLLQFATVDGEVTHNFNTLFKLLKKLHEPFDLLVLPEMWPSGFRVIDGRTLLSETQRVVKILQQFALHKKIFIIGSHLARGPRAYYNRATVIDPKGNIAGHYDKVHLFKLGGEDKTFLSGNKIGLVKTSLGPIGLAICYDIRFPELIRKTVYRGAQILVIPSAWPGERIAHYLALLKARAIENQCYVLSANKVGKNALGMIYGGHSVAYDPWGKRLGELGQGPGILKVTLDMERLQSIRSSFPFLEARRREVYG